MKQILVPTDFSKCAGNAVDFAVQTAKVFPAAITLMHSYEVDSSLYSDYMGVNKEFNRSQLNEANEKLADIKKSIEQNDGMIAETFVSTDSLQESIKKFSATKKADLIVMGTEGASGIKEKLWGSRTADTIGKAGVPVMAIPENYWWKKPQKILFATNQFEKDPAILDYIFEIAGLYMANVLVAVFTDEGDDKAGTLLENKRSIEGYEKFLKETYNEDTLTSVHLIGENFEDTLQDFIKENDIDILVMITYEHKFWNRLFNPSKTKKMSYQTNIPLLAIPSSDSK